MTMKNQSGHSAEVRMTLLLEGQAIRIAQMGPDFLVLDSPVEHPACIAGVTLSVDGREQRWSVRLPEGIRPDQKRVLGARV
jgi:hypothetical protein